MNKLAISKTQRFLQSGWSGTARRVLPLVAVLGQGILLGQTQIDLETQSKSVNFENTPHTKPIRAVAILPSTCLLNEVVLWTAAPPGGNIYVCLLADSWVPQGVSGTLTVQNSGQSAGASQTQNFVAGTGILNIITDLPGKVNIQQSIDSALVVTKTNLRSGDALACDSAPSIPPAFACSMFPALTNYTRGMVLNWMPAAGGTDGAATLTVDLLDPKPLMRADGFTPATGADIEAGQLYSVWFDGAAFRLPVVAAGGGSSPSTGPPPVITSTGAGGSTLLTASAEWHGPLAVCTNSGAAVIWDTPPSGIAGPSAGGCDGATLNQGYAAFPAGATTSLQTSFMLPRTLTGTADVSVYYTLPAAAGTFTPELDVFCTPADGSAVDDGSFILGSFLAAGSQTGPALAGAIGAVSASGIAWPSSCVAGSRAHLRLARIDTNGTASSLNILEVVISLRRTL